MEVRVRSRLVVAVTVVGLIVSGCQTTSFYVSKHLARPGSSLRVLLMPIDVELSELTTGGVAEPNAEWTAKAERFMTAILQERMRKRGAAFAVYEKTERDSDIESDQVQLQKLHGAVGGAIVVHNYAPVFALPNKKGRFDWTLGSRVRILRQRYDADYALFVYLRDSYTSGGRAVAIFLAAALFGVALQGGTQVGFASLVDLDSGDIVWFNVLARATGDLRERKPSEETVTALLENFPK
ncbi:MAG: hypothetical protein ACE5GT_02385 [Rhodospirillales bacterium]